MWGTPWHTWLKDVEILTGLFGLLDAVMLVPPNNQVDEWVQERFRQVVGGTSLGPVLMHHQHVEPLCHWFFGPEHFDLRKEGPAHYVACFYIRQSWVGEVDSLECWRQKEYPQSSWSEQVDKMGMGLAWRFAQNQWAYCRHKYVKRKGHWSKENKKLLHLTSCSDEPNL